MREIAIEISKPGVTANVSAQPQFQHGLDRLLEWVSGLLRRELIDAQILADSLPMDAWARGLAVSEALAMLKRLRDVVSDDQRRTASFIEGHVLEAAAAAAAIGEHLTNRRPVALVMDVGAGTTDVGLYRFALPGDGPFKIFPFAHGRGASTYAGNTLDRMLISFIKNEAGVDDSSADGKRLTSALLRDIRDHKATLFAGGFVDIEELDGRRFSREQFLLSDQASSFKRGLKDKITGFIDQVGLDKMKNPDGLHGVITGGGANVSIFRELFSEPFKLHDGDAHFASLDVQPTWLVNHQPDIRPVFPQLAVSVGACSPDLPDEKNPITDASTAPVRVPETTYR
ncbi:MAG: hypothetical protein JWP35_4067 [Caulobacter sp.]|nr:hypothetical protein [Caulobacter sp.]